MERLQPELWDKRLLTESLRRQRFATRPALAKLFGASELADLEHRNQAIRRAHLEHGYSQSEVRRVVGLHYSTISRFVNRGNEIADARNKI